MSNELYNAFFCSSLELVQGHKSIDSGNYVIMTTVLHAEKDYDRLFKSKPVCYLAKKRNIIW
jgi:hypothetical protein